MSRHKARETALKMLFQLIEGGNDWQMAELTLAEAGLSQAFAQFASELAQGAWAKRFEVEQYIGMFTSGWQYERLCSVDRLVLHLAMYELKYAGSTPAPIVIDEAIELARTFGTDDSPAFVNAVLDNFRRQVLQENSPDYQLDEGLLQRRSVAQEVLPELVEEDAVAAKPELPITEQFAVSAKGFRKIRKAELTDADKILPEPEELEETDKPKDSYKARDSYKEPYKPAKPDKFNKSYKGREDKFGRSEKFRKSDRSENKRY